MTITWTPIRSDMRLTWEQPRQDVLLITGKVGTPYGDLDVPLELDFTDTTIVEYDIPEEERDVVQRAWRENGELHLLLLAHYGPRNQLRDEVTRQYGIGELTW